MTEEFYDAVSGSRFIDEVTLRDDGGDITVKSVYVKIDFDAMRDVTERLARQTMSEDALSRVWDTPQEDARWKDL